MIRVHATKKLLAKLPFEEGGSLPHHQNRLTYQGADSPRHFSGWHANLLILQRRNCILLVHDDTRFPVFIPALTKPDFAALNDRFCDAFMNTLLKCGADDTQMQKAADHLAPLSVDTDCDRSVQGTMNQAGQDLRYIIDERVNIAEMTGYRLSTWLAQRPCMVKGRKDTVWPVAEMFSLIDALPNTMTAEVIDISSGRPYCS